MTLVGALLVAGLGLMVIEAVGYTRGGYNAEFWKLPLDDKLDHVSENRWEWWWISIWGLVALFVVTGGVGGLTYLLDDAGEPVLAYVAFGGYLIAVVAWIFGLMIQAAAVSQASKQRTKTQETPSWIHPFWEAGYFAEGVWVIGANLAYAVIGVALLQSDLVGAWAGWVSLVGGLVVAIGVLATKAGFPQLSLLIPTVIGIALLIESL